MLSAYGKAEWLTISAVSVLLAISVALLGIWWLLIPIALVTGVLLSFFRDPSRRMPSQRGVVLAPADGRVSSIHHLEHYEPLGCPAVCIRIFLSLFNVHINRSPCHGLVESITHRDGDHRTALNADSHETNESNLIVLLHPARQQPIAAVRQVTGILARTIVCGVRVGQIVQRGQRIGMIKLGSTTELYLPEEATEQVVVLVGEKVKGGLSVVAHMPPQATSASTGVTDSGPAAVGREPTRRAP